ncbi:SOS response-associated peptidase [Stappia taiwanensis]|uniref:Abasic site processing protein n=1 Tax=Stappia taiwanensis TaxID=992267 RepID=A0A838XPW1_9HYPH|nr:SOS response-associated peptidase [Stappia taiwanensis]MBA4612242.1 SOS response-associated peptidase [Stappia taiwanensis]GGE92453.1 DUF159 family protein [Stappia taiwanensis]
MCGRYSLTATPEEVRAFFEFVEKPWFPPRYNIAPTQPIATVRFAHGARHFALVRWGLVPGWVKDPASFSLLLNARAETAAEKPSFRAAMRHRRCLIPASGFYEWHRPDAGPKQPYWIRPKAGGMVAFAGLYEEWCDPDGGEIETGAILTVSSNASIAPIHHRMPAVIAKEDFASWLDVGGVSVREAQALLKPAPESLFEAVPVATRINSARDDDPGLQEAVDPVVATPEEKPRETGGKKGKGAARSPAAPSSQLDLF